MTSSSRSYSDRTLKILWGRSAGRCAVPTCRVDVFIDATDYDPMVLIGDIAHIAGASDKGPRAKSSMTAKERDEYQNLIVLCKNCHTRLDGQKNTNTVEMIQKLKDDHEAWIRKSLPERGLSTTGWPLLALSGTQKINVQDAITALSPDFPNGEPVCVEVATAKGWNNIQSELKAVVNSLFGNSDRFEFRLAVFPLAPVSSCIMLGYFLTNRPRVKLFQYHRDEQSWIWPDLPCPANDLREQGFPQEESKDDRDIAIKFELSARIRDDAVAEVMVPQATIAVSIPDPTTAWLQHSDQLVALGQFARTVFEKCLRTFPNAKTWHIFYAGPAPGAVLIGQQINPTMSPRIQLYEYQQGRQPAYQASVLLE